MGITPHLTFKPLIMTGDAFNKYPEPTDCLLVRCSEAEQSARATAAAGAMNNVVAVANRLLSLRIEDLATPLEDERKVERLLTSLVREGSTLTNQLLARAHVLTTSFIRRDAMLRGGLDPTSNGNLFASPWMRNYNYRKTVSASKLEDWVASTGLEAQERQARIVEEWKRVKESREAWWQAKKSEKRGGEQAGQLGAVGTDVVAQVDVESQGQKFGNIEEGGDN